MVVIARRHHKCVDARQVLRACLCEVRVRVALGSWLVEGIVGSTRGAVVGAVGFTPLRSSSPRDDGRSCAATCVACVVFDEFELDGKAAESRGAMRGDGAAGRNLNSPPAG